MQCDHAKEAEDLMLKVNLRFDALISFVEVSNVKGQPALTGDKRMAEDCNKKGSYYLGTHRRRR